MQRSKFEGFAVSGDGRSGSLPLPDQRVAREGRENLQSGESSFKDADKRVYRKSGYWIEHVRLPELTGHLSNSCYAKTSSRLNARG